MGLKCNPMYPYEGEAEGSLTPHRRGEGNVTMEAEIEVVQGQKGTRHVPEAESRSDKLEERLRGGVKWMNVRDYQVQMDRTCQQ